MKKMSFLGLALSISLVSGAGAFAADATKPLTTQQTKMVGCNAQAKEKALKGDERKAFMSDCLKADKAAVTPQQQKMKDCNKQAAGKKGAERKTFMKECLSASTT
jgi:hypothetical protein